MRSLVVLLALGLLAGCGGGDGGADGAAPPAPTSAGPAAGQELAGTTLDGEQLTLGDFRGRPVLVNVWSSW